MSWDPYGDWELRKSITTNNVTGNQLTNHQILIELTTSNFNYSGCEIDGSDIRFSGMSNNALDYWIEEWNYNGDSKIWVKVDTIPTGINTCGYIYYDNPIADSESNGNNTFLFFDNYSTDTTGDYSHQAATQSGAYIFSITDQILKAGRDVVPYGRDTWYQNVSLTGKHAIRLKVTDVTGVPENQILGIGANPAPPGSWKAKDDFACTNTNYNGGQGIGTFDILYDCELSGTLYLIISTYDPSVNTTNYIKIDFIAIRKYESPDPSFVFGNEESVINIDIIGTGSLSVAVPFIESLNFGGYGIFDIGPGIEIDLFAEGSINILSKLEVNEETEFFSKGSISTEIHNEYGVGIEYDSNGNVSTDLHFEYKVNTELIAAGMFPAPSIMGFSDINAFKVTNWNVNKNYDDCMWKLIAPVADLNLPELYKNFRVLAKDHLENEHCIFLGMVPDAEYQLNVAKRTSQITGWDYGFYLSKQKIPRTMWVPDEDINPATLVETLLGDVNWPSVTGIEPYKIITVANWNTEKKQFKWNAGTSKWKAIQDMIQYCKYVFLVKWRETAGGFWYPVAYFVPENIATLDNYLDVPEMLVIFKDNSIISDVTGLGDLIVDIVEPTASAWPKFMQNLSNSGYSDAPTTVIYISSNSLLHAINPDGSGKWTCPIGLSISAPIIDEDGVIYHGCQDDYLYAINPDGSEKWKYQGGDKIQTTPAMDEDGNIWYESDDWDLVKLNHDGVYVCNGWLWGKAYLNSPSIGQNGHIYVIDGAGYLSSFTPDCSENWSDSWGGPWGNGCPAIAGDGTIYIGSGGWLCAMNPDGTDKWWAQATGNVDWCSPSIAADGTIYTGCGGTDPYLYAFWPDGSFRWRYDAPSGFDGCAAIAPDGTIYFGADDGNLYAVNPDGTWKWTYATGDWIFGSPVIGSDGTIYIGGGDHFLHAVNPDGSFKWKYDTGDDIWGSAAIG